MVRWRLLRRWAKYNIIFVICVLPFPCSHLQVRHLDRFSCTITHKLCLAVPMSANRSSHSGHRPDSYAAMMAIDKHAVSAGKSFPVPHGLTRRWAVHSCVKMNSLQDGQVHYTGVALETSGD